LRVVCFIVKADCCFFLLALARSIALRDCFWCCAVVAGVVLVAVVVGAGQPSFLRAGAIVVVGVVALFLLRR